jgi:hypothetical protein
MHATPENPRRLARSLVFRKAKKPDCARRPDKAADQSRTLLMVLGIGLAPYLSQGTPSSTRDFPLWWYFSHGLIQHNLAETHVEIGETKSLGTAPEK